jgi:hypothetical protein
MSNRNRKQKAVQTDAVLFDLIILGFFLLFAFISFAYNPRARSIPLALGILGSVMMLMQLLVDALPGLRSKLRFVSATGLLAKEDQTRLKGSEEPDSEGIPVVGRFHRLARLHKLPDSRRRVHCSDDAV